MQAPPRLSIVIPAYNEEARILGSLMEAEAYLLRGREAAEILVVDDGSVDGTAGMVERFARERPQAGPVSVRLLHNGRNRGKGYSIKHGVLMALGELVLISDADFSTPIDELPILRQAVENEGYGIAIGSRGLEQSRELRDVNGLAGDKKRGFKDLLDFGQVGHRLCCLHHVSSASTKGRSPFSWT